MIKQLTSTARQILLNQADQVRAALNYPHPICRLVVDGRDITASITSRLISISLTDNRGMEADQLDIQLSDHDGNLAIPPKNAIVQLWLGWSDIGLINKGTYKVDELEHSGAPDTLSIRARSADLREGLAKKRERSWHNQTLGAIITSIAMEYGLKPLVQTSLAARILPHIDQAGESDLNLITRLASEHDATASIKAGHLLFLPTGAATTASGLALPHITLTRADGDQHRYLDANRDTYTGVKAYYYETNSAARKEAIAGTGDNLKELRHTYTDQASALEAARAEWRRLQRGMATLSYVLAKGRPDLIPELTYSLTGIKQQISDIIWLGGNVQHSFTPDAYITSLELTSQLPESEELVSDAETQYTGVLAWYRDEKTGKQKKLTEGDQSKPKRLTHLYASKASAQRAVKRETQRLTQTKIAT